MSTIPDEMDKLQRFLTLRGAFDFRHPVGVPPLEILFRFALPNFVTPVLRNMLTIRGGAVLGQGNYLRPRSIEMHLMAVPEGHERPAVDFRALQRLLHFVEGLQVPNEDFDTIQLDVYQTPLVVGQGPAKISPAFWDWLRG